MLEVIRKTGRKGTTFLVRYASADALKSTKFMDAAKSGAIDVLLGGKMTVLPPSLHPDTNRPYLWGGRGLVDADLRDMPLLTKRALALLKRIVSSENAKNLAAGDTTHDAGVGMAASLVQFGCGDDEAEAIIKALLPIGYDGNSLEELPEWIKSAREKGFDRPNGRSRDGKKQPSPVESLMASLSDAGFSFFHDAERRGFMSIRRDGGGTLTYLLGSKPGNLVLSQYAYSLGHVLRESSLKDLNTALTAQAVHAGPEEDVFVRIARKGDTIYVDRGAADGSVVRITRDGFDLASESPVKFLRSTGMLPLPVPRVGGAIAELQGLLNLPQGTFTLLLAFLLGSLRAGGPYMCLLVEGEQGSGKSFLCNVIRRIIDPNLAGSIRLPDKERELMVLANEMFLLSFDNSSGMKANISDLLCSLATGAGYVARKLYSDGDLHIMRAVRPFIINGISDLATRPDLLERAIALQLERPDEEGRKTEAEMLAQLEAILPDVLGALYQIVACALRNENLVEPPRSIRMADVAHWLRAGEPATGLPENAFLSALELSQAERMIERTNNEPIVVALRDLLQKGPYKGTIGWLLQQITPERNKPQFFPSTALQLSKGLKRLKTGMNLAGIYFEYGGRGNQGQKISVWLEGQEGQAPQRFPDTEAETNGPDF